LAVIEDAAQAVGARYHGQRVGSFGVAGCFSLHPLKNLNACGDGGVITTNEEAIYRYLLKARNHGLRNRDDCEFWSLNSRLDALHAAMLRVKLKYLDAWTEARRSNAAFYREHLADAVQVPQDQPHEYAVYHTFIIQADQRDELQRHLMERGVETKVHYPIPIHLQEAAQSLGCRPGHFPVAERLSRRILSLPIYPELSEEQKEAVVVGIRSFYG
jgi:dTDP-4-amino-4,6-dideoxygalactose transaminase